MSDEKEVKLPNIKVPVSVETAGEQSFKTQGEVDREESRLRLEAERLRIKRELMEIKKLEYDLQKIEHEAALSQVSHEQVESVISDTNRETEIHHSNCNHMKGGAAETLQPGKLSWVTTPATTR